MTLVSVSVMKGMNVQPLCRLGGCRGRELVRRKMMRSVSDMWCNMSRCVCSKSLVMPIGNLGDKGMEGIHS